MNDKVYFEEVADRILDSVRDEITALSDEELFQYNIARDKRFDCISGAYFFRGIRSKEDLNETFHSDTATMLKRIANEGLHVFLMRRVSAPQDSWGVIIMNNEYDILKQMHTNSSGRKGFDGAEIKAIDRFIIQCSIMAHKVESFKQVLPQELESPYYDANFGFSNPSVVADFSDINALTELLINAGLYGRLTGGKIVETLHIGDDVNKDGFHQPDKPEHDFYAIPKSRFLSFGKVLDVLVASGVPVTCAVHSAWKATQDIIQPTPQQIKALEEKKLNGVWRYTPVSNSHTHAIGSRAGRTTVRNADSIQMAHVGPNGEVAGTTSITFEEFYEEAKSIYPECPLDIARLLWGDLCEGKEERELSDYLEDKIKHMRHSYYDEPNMYRQMSAEERFNYNERYL